MSGLNNNQLDLKLKNDPSLPSKEQLKEWRRRIKIINGKLRSKDGWLLGFMNTVQARVKKNLPLSEKQQYYLAHYAGEKWEYLKQFHDDKNRNGIDINEQLDILSREES